MRPKQSPADAVAPGDRGRPDTGAGTWQGSGGLRVTGGFSGEDSGGTHDWGPWFKL